MQNFIFFFLFQSLLVSHILLAQDNDFPHSSYTESKQQIPTEDNLATESISVSDAKRHFFGHLGIVNIKEFQDIRRVKRLIT